MDVGDPSTSANSFVFGVQWGKKTKDLALALGTLYQGLIPVVIYRSNREKCVQAHLHARLPSHFTYNLNL
jgi:hypothetical protein